MKKEIVLLTMTSVLLLTGCGQRVLQGYEGEQLNPNQVATIIQCDRKENKGTGKYSSTINLRKIDDERIVLSPHTTYLLPGSHTLLYNWKCHSYGVEAHPTITIDVEAGRTYKICANYIASSVMLEHNDVTDSLKNK